MSDMKCPFCDSEIEQLNDQQRSLLHCSNIVCCKGGHYIGNTSMWRDLIRTRKALDVAVKAMESAKYFRLEHCMCCGHDPQKDVIYIKLKKTLKQITTLEQKDVK